VRGWSKSLIGATAAMLAGLGDAFSGFELGSFPTTGLNNHAADN
jgi:hypothetical protein